MTRRLSITVPFHPDEDIWSFASRLAHANHGRGLYDFCQELGIGYRALLSGEDTASADLLALCGLTFREDDKRLIRRSDAGYIINGQAATLTSFRRTPLTYCSICLSEDLEKQRGNRKTRPYRRMHWPATSIRTCLTHQVMMTTARVPREGRARYDFVPLAMTEMQRPDFGSLTVEAAVTPFERHVHDRLWGSSSGDSWIDTLPLYVVETLCEYIGLTKHYGRQFRFKGKSLEEIRAGAQEGFEIISEGKEGFSEFLKSMHDIFWERRTFVRGQGLYGTLYDFLRRQKGATGYRAVAQVVRDTALANLPFGPESDLFKDILGPVTERKIHSLYSASVEYGVQCATLRKNFIAAGLIAPGTAELSPERIVLPAKIVDDFMVKLNDSLDRSAVEAYLDASRSVVNTIITGGYIENTVASRHHGVSVRSLYPKAGLDALLKRMADRATVSGDPDEKFHHLKNAAKIVGCTFKEALDALLDGKLKFVALDRASRGINVIKIDASELTDILRPAPYEGWTIEEATKRLRTSHSVVCKLVSLGILKTESVLNSRTYRKQKIIQFHQLEKFMTDYISLTEYAHKIGAHFRQVTAGIEQSGIRPAFSRDAIGATFYHRRDLE